MEEAVYGNITEKGGHDMSRILLSTGNYAEIPYFFEKTYVNL